MQNQDLTRYNTMMYSLLWTNAGNRPPNITGSFLMYVNAGESVSKMYNADDPDGDTISTFNLKVFTLYAGIRTEAAHTC